MIKPLTAAKLMRDFRMLGKASHALEKNREAIEAECIEQQRSRGAPLVPWNTIFLIAEPILAATAQE